ncbi:MAG: hypothetical protein DMG65_07850 [Candidatus Angelobacter sp. Gp1-AA117]|nr:MAG: hypothetical protein DMG65_07850 [Candidatus Angelobacter sp. Gp1-AA117]
MPSKGKPTAADSQLILRLYDLRREAVMRKARAFLTTEFWPSSYDEFKAIAMAFGTEHNAYFRQVFSYWDMVAAMVLAGTINEDLFFQTNGEPYFFWAKYKDFVPQTRKDFGNPDFLQYIEKLATKSTQAKERVKRIETMLKTRAAQMSAAKAGK